MTACVVLTYSYTLSETSAFRSLRFTSAKEPWLLLYRTLGGPQCRSGRLGGVRNI